MPSLRLANLIDGRLQAPRQDRWLDVFEPASGEVFAHCPDSSADDVDAAVAAAHAAAPAWAATPSEQRARLLQRLADLVEARLDAFAALESRDSGKPLSLARSLDIPRAVSNLRYFAAAIVPWSSESHAMELGAINYTLRQPLGVVGCISPWNLPLYLFTWKIAPALAAGNAVVAKPSEITPCTAALLGELSIEAGFPPGVLNIVQGRGPSVGQALVEHAQVKAISFTGSTRTGAQIAAAAAPRFKKLSLELGGKNPAIVFADADLSEANLDTIVRSGFANQGEICLCGSRLLVQRSIYDDFRARYLAKVRALRVGDPRDASSDLGALVSREHFEKVMGCIEQARAEGGQVLCGGESLALPGPLAGGWYVAPTVVEGLAPEAATNQHEIFGPVVSLIPFDDEDEALAIANGTGYGLAASLWTADLSRAHRFGARLDVGIVWINCWLLRDLRTPFGGTRQSGVGREGGVEALRFFTEPKNICIRY
ncbi:aminomuconate-semialdehyde/2-hydroxymuconate-6-semialdehyde dehydrogenase [Dyella sp. SG562]|uniref:aldehyde dehydrogenase n=1 Tax=Dyella sp. SG562 TaxID=2587017 RepID=UPI00141FF30E|nr:aldehyde dehydrogenase [Dyella sp. SG562]NII75602.1 aminomuconate-semialdehyde/2-hydroxymuconate-6-semialdehyde dehydrogenase [Dyella sp. SG562]